MSLRTSLKNTKRKSKDERQKKERSEGEKSDNSRVEKGEEELDKKMREKKEEKQKESEDFSYSNATNLSSFSSCFVSYVGTFGEEPSSDIQPTLKSLKEDQYIFSRELMEFLEQVQGKENTLEMLQGKIAYPSTLDTLVDCGDTLSLKDSYDIDEFDISLSCDEKNNCGLQLAKSSCGLLDDSSSLFNDSLASDDVESYDSPPLWDDACDDSFDSTLTLLVESFELYEKTTQENVLMNFLILFPFLWKKDSIFMME
ncbi:PREDICTED: uncharacterized protein LOC109243769 [Nicotiana attenuata]|uniref:uncharacterized protein LOC109243769 n=1 Tax=Nicotiana attenuata TaxID=49451 RepID=UPI000904DA51|nr:PREDICTED: uncharacterized protein LOC109243769 [Nicotiana attenuata]